MSFKHCHPDTASCSLSAMCVVNRGEHEWVTHLSVTLICSYMFSLFSCLIDTVSERELGFSGWLTQTPGSDSHWASEWAGTQPGYILIKFSVFQPKSFIWHIMKYYIYANINNLWKNYKKSTVMCPLLYMRRFSFMLSLKMNPFAFLLLMVDLCSQVGNVHYKSNAIRIIFLPPGVAMVSFLIISWWC